MELIIQSDGQTRCVYDETIDLPSLGRLSIRRASHVEPDGTGSWYADLLPVRGPMLGPFKTRSEALKAETAWLQEHWLEGDA